MITINKSNATQNYYLSCPYCYYILTFYKSSPVYCTKCGEELSNYSKLVEDINERKTYYILGSNKWEMGVA